MIARPWFRVCCLAVVISLSSAIVHALWTPALRGPDELWHLDYVVHMGEHWDVPDIGEPVSQTPARPTLETLLGAGRNSISDLRASDAPPRADRPLYGESSPRDFKLLMAQHPPAYYVVGGAWDRMLEAFDDHRTLDLRGMGLRLLSLALAAVTVIMLVMAAH